MRRIGVLLHTSADDVDYQAYLGAFHQGLAQSGWIIGRNVPPLCALTHRSRTPSVFLPKPITTKQRGFPARFPIVSGA
jgi:hypothetical protein